MAKNIFKTDKCGRGQNVIQETRKEFNPDI